MNYRLVQRPGKKKPDKVPVTPAGAYASTTDPMTWSTFAEAQAALERPGVDGVSSVLVPVFGVDIDGCRNTENGELSPFAQEATAALPIYWEVSPSGTGIRGFGYGHLPVAGRRNDAIGLELYASGRHLTVTGKQLAGSADHLVYAQKELGAFYDKHFPELLPKPAPIAAPIEPVASIALDDTAIIAKMRASSPRAERLWTGDLSDYRDLNHPDGDHSRADAALLRDLIWWFNGDQDRAATAFRDSALYREKWERADYRERTLRLAMSGFTGGYTGTAPIPIRPTVAVATGESRCPELEARIAQLEAENATLREVARVAVAERTMAQQHVLDILGALKNAALGPIASTFVATTSRVFGDISTNRTGADGVRLYRADLAKATGQSESTISLHLNSTQFKTFYEKKTTREVLTNRETGETLINPDTGKPRFRTVIEVWPRHLSQQAMYAAAADYAAEQETRSARREPLRERCRHPRLAAGVICPDCGEVWCERPATEAERAAFLEAQSAIPEDTSAPTVDLVPSTSQSAIPELPAAAEVGEANSSITAVLRGAELAAWLERREAHRPPAPWRRAAGGA